MGKILCFCSLLLLAGFDLKEHMVPAMLLIVNIACALGYQIMVSRNNFFLILGGAAVGCLFLVFSFLTKEVVGYGDGLGILGIGIYHGLWDVLDILLITFGVLTVASIGILIYKKMSRTIKIPFYPFLVIGYGLWCI